MKFAWTWAFLVMWSPGLIARDAGVEVRATSALVVETAPGKVITASFLVANRDARDGMFAENLTLPPGWLKIAPADDRFPLAAHSEELRLLAILVPMSTASGNAEVRYTVRNTRDNALTDGGRFTVRVQAVSRLEITVEDKPDAVIAGENYEVKVRVMNHGNSTNRIRLAVTSSPQTEVSQDPSELVLAPASTQTVRVRAKTSDALTGKITQVLSFQAAGTDPAGKTTTASSRSAAVDVIPRITGNTDIWNRLPAQMQIMGAHETGHDSGMQAEFSGAGYLDETGTRKTDFLFRGPNLQQKSMYGQRQESRVSYYDPLFDVHAGDRSYTLSPLLERYGYGRGAEVDLHTTNNTARILYLENHPDQPTFSETGGSYSHTFTPWFTLQGNYLNRKGNGHSSLTNGLAQSIYSVEPKLHLGKALELDLEYAISCDSDQGGGSDQAMRLDMRGEFYTDVYYEIEKIYAGPDFYGSYNDVDSLQTSLVFPIYKKLRGHISFSEYDNNLEKNSAKSTTATRETTYRPGIRYTLPFQTELLFDYQHIERSDVLPPAAYNFTEDSIRVGIGKTFGRLNIQTSVERGQLQDRVLDQTTDSLHRYSLYASYRPSARQTYSVYTRLGNSSFTSNLEQSKTYGVSANWRLMELLTVDASGERNIYEYDTGRQQDMVRSVLNYTFRNHQKVALTGRWSQDNITGQEETSIFICYTIPFDLPICKKTSVGSLKGRVFDQESPVHQPLSRVILSLNDAWAVTDSRGEFVFPALAPGKYLLRVDTASLGANRITAASLPITVEVKKGKPVTLDLGVVTTASITLRVAVASPSTTNAISHEVASASRPAETALSSHLTSSTSSVDGPCEGILVELSKDTEKLLAYTDTAGRATFDHLRPGQWRCKVRENNLPAYHYVEHPDIKLAL